MNQTAEYAVRAVIAIAAFPPGMRAQARPLAEELDIPPQYLAKILQVLAVKRVLASTRGRGGGFWLARPASEMRLLEVLRCFEEDPKLTRCVMGLDYCDDHNPCALNDFWNATRDAWAYEIEKRSLQDLVDGTNPYSYPKRPS